MKAASLNEKKTAHSNTVNLQIPGQEVGGSAKGLEEDIRIQVTEDGKTCSRGSI